MKSLLTCLLAALTLGLVAKDNEIDLQSTITDVVVYQQGAQVERQSRATIPAGTSILRFTELHPGIDPNQIRFNGTGDFSILAMYYDYQVDTIAGQESQRIRVKLQEERAVIQHQINVENSFLDIYNRELNMLQLTGRLSWELTVKPGKSERLTFKYALRYPKNMLLALGR